MSIYYNVKLRNGDQEEIKFNVDSQSYIPVLRHQERYQVGVKRFKIPTSQIDFYRIYQYRQILSTQINSKKNGVIQTGKMLLTDMFIDDCILSNEYDSDNELYYNTINSNDEYAEYLNACINKNMIDSQLLNYTTLLPGGSGSEGLCVYNGAHSGITSVNLNFSSTSATLQYNMITGYYTSTTPVPSPGTTALPKKIVDLEFTITNIDVSAYPSYASMMLSDVLIYLTMVDNSGNVVERIPLVMNLATGYNVSQFNTVFPNGIKVSTRGRPNMMTHSNFKNTGQPVHMSLPRTEDIYKILMKYGEYYDYNICLIERNQLLKSTIDLDCSLNLYMNNDNFYSGGSDLGDPINPYTDIGSITVQPYFNFDVTSQRIVFNAENIAFKNGFGIFENDGLKNAMGYDCNSIKGYDPGLLFNNKSSFINSNLNGGFIRFTSLPNSVSTILPYPEQQKSVFKRNYLYSIVIIADSLAIDGEFVGDGSSQQKILSDFEIDPGSNFRDYLVYQPQGDSVRYFDLNGYAELYQVNIQVMYLDMNDNMKQLNIGQDFMGSVKLHFKLKV